MKFLDMGRHITPTTGAAHKFGEGSGAGESPFTESRNAVLVISPSEDFAGTVQVQQSQDGGTTWTSLLAGTNQATDEVVIAGTKGQVFYKNIVIPNQLRAQTPTRNAGSVRFGLLGGT